MAHAQPTELGKYRDTLWGYLETLTGFGPRYVGTVGYDRTLQLLRQVGREFADEVVEHPFVIRRENGEQVSMVNIELVFHGSAGGPPVLIGAHYDTRPFADEEFDPEARTQPIQGANDGGSGTAVLLGLARYLENQSPRLPVRLMFFDGEDFGTTGSGEMFTGSNYHANQLKLSDPKTWPRAVLIADMVGDRDLQIYKESYSVKSGPKLLDRIYSVAQRQNISQFHTYSNPARDPRQHTISTVFVARAGGVPRAASDARNIGVFTGQSLPEPLVFDHADILKDYFSARRNKE